MPGLRTDRRGNVAITAGLLALPLLGLVGLAIDFGSAVSVKTQLDLAADTAALLAVTDASNAYMAGARDPIAPAQAAGRRRFDGQASSIMGASVGTVTVAVQQSGSVFNADVTYQAAAPTTLGSLFGTSVIPITGRSTSSIAVNPFVDIQILMDVSSSMTIAATQPDIDRLLELTRTYVPTGKLPGNVSRGESCGFACHWTATGDDYYALAKRNGVPLRIDMLRAAVSNLITNIAALNTHNAFRLGMYTFAQTFTPIYPLSGQIAAASGALDRIAPDVNDCSNNCPETYFASAMANLTAATSPSGNGSAPASSQKYLFIVTDGLVDQFSPSGRQIGPVSAADCAAMKAKGVTILTLYTPYLPLPTNGFYNQFVAPIQSRIGPALQACASSPALYYEAANAADIDARLRTMLSTVLRTSGHLTR